MDDKQRGKHEKMFQEDDFPFKKCAKTAEMIRKYYKEGGHMADCCSMMKRMINSPLPPVDGPRTRIEKRLSNDLERTGYQLPWLGQANHC